MRRESNESRRKTFLGEDGEPFDIAQFLTIYPNPETFFVEERKIDENYTKHATASFFLSH